MRVMRVMRVLFQLLRGQVSVTLSKRRAGMIPAPPATPATTPDCLAKAVKLLGGGIAVGFVQIGVAA